MIDKLLILHEKGVIRAALLVVVLRSAVATICVGVDPEKERAYCAVNAGKKVKRADYEAAVGIFAKRLTMTNQQGQVIDHPADSLLLALKGLDVADILTNATAGKYMVYGGKLTLNPNWTEPLIEIGGE